MKRDDTRKNRLYDCLSQNDAAMEICRSLNKKGYQAYFVGGLLRDILKGHTVPHDVDLATDAHPSVTQQWAEQRKIKTSLRGLSYGAIKLYVGASPIVVTTFRRERYEGDKPLIVFVKTIEEDAVRRDFTINAIYADCDGQLFDPMGGLSDLDAQRVQFVGDPAKRIQEDPFRMLRYFRLRGDFADLGQKIEVQIREAFRQFASCLCDISTQRKEQEMMKLFSAKAVYPILVDMQECGLLPYCLPPVDIGRLNRLEHLETLYGVSPSPFRRLAALGINGPKKPLLLWNRRWQRQLERLIHWVESGVAAHELAYRLGRQQALDILLVRAVSHDDTSDCDFFPRIEHASGQVFPVKAEDLMPQIKGKKLGQVLKRLERSWLESNFLLSRDELLERVRVDIK